MSLILLDSEQASGITGSGSVTIAAPAVAGTGTVIEGVGTVGTIADVYAEWVPWPPKRQKVPRQHTGQGRVRFRGARVSGRGSVVHNEHEELWMLGLEDEEFAA